MKRIGLTLAALAGFAATGLAADFEVNFPYGNVRVNGRRVEVDAPYTTVRVDGKRVAVDAPYTTVRVDGKAVEVVAPQADVKVEAGQAQPAKPAQPAGEKIAAPKEAPPPPIVAVSHYDFGYSFKPQAGNYVVDLIHPRTGCPVRVCFSLPCGCPKVEVRCDEIEFDYGKREVEIEFRKDGRVVVEYN